MPAGLAETLNDLLSSARYRVEGESMSPAFNHGDQVLAARIRGPYRRGDVVVFRQPFDSPGIPSKVYIKRIIGLPQEEIFLDEDAVRINGTLLPEGYLKGASRGTGAGPADVPVREKARIWITDPGEYFVMGDRRDNTQDSRSFGPVNESFMLGRVWLRYWPLGAWGKISRGGQT